jgi:hypothetical protein
MNKMKIDQIHINSQGAILRLVGHTASALAILTSFKKLRTLELDRQHSLVSESDLSLVSQSQTLLISSK